MTGEEWDTRGFRIYDDARADGVIQAKAEALADRECTEQFGDRPEAENSGRLS